MTVTLTSFILLILVSYTAQQDMLASLSDKVLKAVLCTGCDKISSLKKNADDFKACISKTGNFDVNFGSQPDECIKTVKERLGKFMAGDGKEKIKPCMGMFGTELIKEVEQKCT